MVLMSKQVEVPFMALLALMTVLYSNQSTYPLWKSTDIFGLLRFTFEHVETQNIFETWNTFPCLL